MSTRHRIETLEQLRERMGAPSSAVAAKVIDGLDAFARDFIAHSPFLILSTADGAGRQDASPKGDGPGFVRVIDDHTLAIPDRKGNKLLYGLENILQNPQVGLIFMIPGCEETLRVNGQATISTDPELLASMAARGQDALLAIVVRTEEVFFHCAKSFRRSALWKPETWQPYEVSFGKIMAARFAREGDRAFIEQVDEAIEKDAVENL